MLEQLDRRSAQRLDTESATELVAEAGARVVAQYGTGLLATTVSTSGNGFTWRRTPGPLAPAPFVPQRGELLGPLQRISTLGGARLALGTAEGKSLTYHARGSESTARRLLSDGPQADLEQAIGGLGQLLRAMHDRTPPGTQTEPPRVLARLGTWLAGRAPDPYVAAAGCALRRTLGSHRWNTLLRWYRCVMDDEARVIAHGCPSLGGLVVGEDTDAGTADLLTGEDLCLAPWYFDLGWVLGDLVELKWYLHGETGQWQRLSEALFDGYGQDLGPLWNRMATLRIATHLHDYVSYVGWPGDDFTQYANFLGFLIDL